MSDSRVPFEQAATLMDKYKAAYRSRYREDPVMNVVSTKYALRDIIVDIGYNNTSKLFGFFFRTTGSHEIKRFIYNYDELFDMMKRQERDAERRQRLKAKELG